ncbi:hypothetical protein FDP41_010454 [Naegleria fowleri]|uniref:Uncharacterized protein n=1 Tax=Naegleria fowleri TaxID=5763 RepID=A0A6A5CDL5_NAEFO|nr:uncharacterized protein FDP41_010454 [Naegleria fowleri]KAF0983389.1 hypothetical protein FDP41_010454 [Naegleria fowleri]
MQDKTKGHVEKNALERISKIVNNPLFATNKVEFDLIVTASGNWETYSKKFLDIIGSYSRVENKPVLYSIGREFFFDKRDATASLNGYLYQVDLTVNYWLDTLRDENSDKCVMLEFGEDIAVLPIQSVLDIERFSGKSEPQRNSITDDSLSTPLLIFEQAKLYKKPIPFNSDSTQANIIYRFTTNFKSFCEQDWNAAVSFLSRVEFIEKMTCEKVAQSIEEKLSKYYACRNFKTLSNCLYGFVKSQLLEQGISSNGKFSKSMMLDQTKLKEVISSIIMDFSSP